MDKKKKALILLLALVALLTAAVILYRSLAGKAPAPQTPDSAQEGGGEAQTDDKLAAPNFTMTDAAGNAVTYADVAAAAGGKPVILNFWTSWCGYCKQEMPDFEQAYKDYGGQIEFIMLDAQTNEYTADAGAAYVAEQGFTFPVYYDANGEAVAVYGVRGFPATVAVDADGYVVYAQSGMLTADALEQLIDELLEKA